MHILLLSPFHGGSHQHWAEGYQAVSRHRVEVLGLPARHWKWRMHGAAVHFARALAGRPRPDLVLATDMLDLAAFLGLARRWLAAVPVVLYCHENQLTYPWSPQDPDPAQQRDRHYAFINFTSALAADRVLFNSQYHRDAFLTALPRFLAAFPDRAEADAAATIQARSQVLPVGLDLTGLAEPAPPATAPPLVLWNHRWEYDKDPEAFFALMQRLADDGLAFRLAILGQRQGRVPGVFAAARNRLGERIVQFGTVPNRRDYAAWLRRAQLLPVTARHDFFGISVVEAIAAGCRPLLPRRLAYPEHLPPELAQAYLYDDPQDLYQRARRALLDPTPAAPQLAHWVGRYDWSRQGPRYDALFEALAAGAEPPAPEPPCFDPEG